MTFLRFFHFFFKNKKTLKRAKINMKMFATMNNTQCTDTGKSKMNDLVQKLEDITTGKMLTTIVIDDPAGNGNQINGLFL